MLGDDNSYTQNFVGSAKVPVINVSYGFMWRDIANRTPRIVYTSGYLKKLFSCDADIS